MTSADWPAGVPANHSASIKKPIHNVKHLPAAAVAAPEVRFFVLDRPARGAEVVEPVGIEPTTSSLQS
jgi:hypothetical protein